MTARANRRLCAVVADLRRHDWPAHRIAAALDLPERRVPYLARAGGWCASVVPGVVTRVRRDGTWEVVRT